jgi:hypothetical protein
MFSFWARGMCNCVAQHLHVRYHSRPAFVTPSANDATEAGPDQQATNRKASNESEIFEFFFIAGETTTESGSLVSCLWNVKKQVMSKEKGLAIVLFPKHSVAN